MLQYPNFDPVAIALGTYTLPVIGTIAPKIHWYGLTYLAAFYGAWWLAVRRGRMAHVAWPESRVSDVLFYFVLGTILGGRIGYVLFYKLADFMAEPLMIIRIWQGGMSFHGGLCGVLIAMLIFARQQKMSFFSVTDVIAVVVPWGLFTGRIGNFINGELWGAPTDVPWGMIFPTGGDVVRHPTMLYEALLEGLVMLGILWHLGKTPRKPGYLSAMFLLLYASFRFAVEFLRTPDAHLGYLHGTNWFTMGMQLCVPMFIGGLVILWWSSRQKPVLVSGGQ